MAGIKQVWKAADLVSGAANDIEGGARDSDTDAQIIYLPRPGAEH